METYPLTKRSMAAWARWKAGNPSARAWEERGLHADEVAGLRQLEGNLFDAGLPKGWFRETGTGITLDGRAEQRLFRRLRVEVGAVADLARALKAVGAMPLGGPFVLDEVVRRVAGVKAKREPAGDAETHLNAEGERVYGSGLVVGEIHQVAAMRNGSGAHWTEQSPAIQPGKATRTQRPESVLDPRQRKEREVSITLPPTNGVAPPKWKAGDLAFAESLEAARKLGIPPEPLPSYTDRRRIARLTPHGYTESTVCNALKDYALGRRPEGRADEPPAEKAAAVPIEVPVTRREESVSVLASGPSLCAECGHDERGTPLNSDGLCPVCPPRPPTITEVTTHPVVTMRQGEPETEHAEPAEVIRRAAPVEPSPVNTEYLRGYNKGVEMGQKKAAEALDAECARLRAELDTAHHEEQRVTSEVGVLSADLEKLREHMKGLVSQETLSREWERNESLCRALQEARQELAALRAQTPAAEPAERMIPARKHQVPPAAIPEPTPPPYCIVFDEQAGLIEVRQAYRGGALIATINTAGVDFRQALQDAQLFRAAPLMRDYLWWVVREEKLFGGPEKKAREALLEATALVPLPQEEPLCTA